MPTDHTPNTSALPDGSAVSILVDGDKVNSDALYKEVAPGLKKKLTLGLVADWCTSMWTSGGASKLVDHTFTAPSSGTLAAALGNWTATTIGAVLQRVWSGAVYAGDDGGLASNGSASDGAALVGVHAFGGANVQGVDADSTLREMLLAIVTDAASLTASAAQTVAGKIVANGGVEVAGAKTVKVYNGASLEIGAGGYESRTTATILDTTTAATLDVTVACAYRAEAWNGGGGTLTCTLANYAGSGEPVLDLFFSAMTSGKTLVVNRASGTMFAATLTKGAAIKMRWSRTYSIWRYEGPGPLSGDPAEITTLNS